MTRSTGIAVALLSAAVLAYEVLLIRLLSIVQWQHFTYMVISVALLGFGASGSFLALAGRRLAPRFPLVFAVNAVLFGVLALVAFLLAQILPFNALAVMWEPRQFLLLLGLCLLFVVPFFFGANCICLAFIRFGGEIGRVYLYNLVGSGLGSAGLLILLFALKPEQALRGIAVLAILAAALVLFEVAGKGRRSGLVALLLALLVLVLPATWTELRVSPFKPLSQALQVQGARLVGTSSNPLAHLSLLQNQAVPFRHVPGLSLNSSDLPPPQLGVFADGGGLDVITSFDGRLAPLRYLDFTLSALPYHLIERPAVLLFGAGGGAGVLQAVYHAARRIDAVEANPDRVELVRRDFSDFAGGLYERPELQLHIAAPRALLARSDARWDLIQMPLLGSAGGAGDSLRETYVYTREAFEAYLRHLRPNGLLAVTRWLRLPPRESLKLFATAVEALRRNGAADPGAHLALLRGWNSSLLLVGKQALDPGAQGIIRAFASARSFDIAWLPGLEASEVNRFNILERPLFHAGAKALAGADGVDYIRRYKFDISPVSDDRPYFFDFFKWRSLAEFTERLARGAGLLEWSYPILLATLFEVALLSLLLILLPLRFLRGQGANKGRVFLYFSALGLAFFFLEVAFIQHFTLFLGAPLYAAAVVIAGFLVFAGCGSGCSAALRRRLDSAVDRTRFSALSLAVVAIAAIALVYIFALPPLLAVAIAFPEAARLAVAMALIAPLAFCMGMPFPLGLARVEATIPELLPWAWGINGCASVIAVILAQILALHFGFKAVLATGMVIYLGAGFVFRRPLGAAADT